MKTNHHIFNVEQKGQRIYLYIATARLVIQIIKRATLRLRVFLKTMRMVFYLHINKYTVSQKTTLFLFFE